MTSSERSLWAKIVLVGDSITQGSFSYLGGWGTMLDDSLLRRCDVLSRGLSGYNTRQWRSVCRAVPPNTLNGHLAIIFLGANDAAANNPQQFVPLDEYKDNLVDIASVLKEQCGVPEVLLMTPPPADETAMPDYFLADGRSGALTAQYATACRETGAAHQLPVLDIHTRFLEQENWRSFFKDGLHFNREGSEFLFSVMDPVVRGLVKRFMPANMDPEDMILPSFDVASNTYPSPEIFQWVLDHPVPEVKKGWLMLK